MKQNPEKWGGDHFWYISATELLLTYNAYHAIL